MSDLCLLNSMLVQSCDWLALRRQIDHQWKIHLVNLIYYYLVLVLYIVVDQNRPILNRRAIWKPRLPATPMGQMGMHVARVQNKNLQPRSWALKQPWKSPIQSRYHYAPDRVVSDQQEVAERFQGFLSGAAKAYYQVGMHTEVPRYQLYLASRKCRIFPIFPWHMLEFPCPRGCKTCSSVLYSPRPRFIAIEAASASRARPCVTGPCACLRVA